jgi:hypothetical protein
MRADQIRPAQSGGPDEPRLPVNSDLHLARAPIGFDQFSRPPRAELSCRRDARHDVGRTRCARREKRRRKAPRKLFVPFAPFGGHFSLSPTAPRRAGMPRGIAAIKHKMNATFQLAAIERGVAGGKPYCDDLWAMRTLGRLGTESSQRPDGWPKNPKRANG